MVGQVRFDIPLPWDWAALAAAGGLAAILLGLLRWLLRRRRPPERPVGQLDLSIDIASLDPAGPPHGATALQFYGTPVRVAVVVLAPVGREGTLPHPDRLPAVLEQLVTGLADVVAEHRPILRFWPRQLSSVGFTNAFFKNLRLPGNRGKGTPWCSIAGKFSTVEGQLLAGLVCCADRPNGLSQVRVRYDGQWQDVLRVQRR